MAQTWGASGLSTETAPVRTDSPDVDEEVDLAEPWKVVVWNDPVNLMSYVTWAFQVVFGYSRQKSNKLMLEVHNDGRSIVWTGTRERAEAYVSALHEKGLWATMEQK